MGLPSLPEEALKTDVKGCSACMRALHSYLGLQPPLLARFDLSLASHNTYSLLVARRIGIGTRTADCLGAVVLT